MPQPADTQGQAEQKLPFCAVEVPQPADTQGQAEQKLPFCAVGAPQPADTQGQAEQKLPFCAVEVPQPADTQGQAEQKLPFCAVEVPQPANTQGHAEQKQRLSGREAAILSALVEGASNKLIAYQLKITEATVKVHVKAILRKISESRIEPRRQIWALNRQSPAKLDAGEGGSLLTQTSLGYGRGESPLIAPRASEVSSVGAGLRSALRVLD